MSKSRSIEPRSYLVHLDTLTAVQRRGIDLKDFLKNRTIVVSRRGVHSVSFMRFPAKALREFYDRVRMLHAKIDSKEQKTSLEKLQRAIESSVDVASRETVLGVRPRSNNAAKKLPQGTHFRFYIHTLDDRPAVFMGNRLEYATQTQQHNQAATSIAQIHREQRAVFKACFDLGVDRGEMQKRIGYRSFKVEG